MVKSERRLDILVFLVIRVVLEVQEICLEIIIDANDLRSQGLGVVIAFVFLESGAPEQVFSSPERSARLNDVGNDRTATHSLLFGFLENVEDFPEES
ncbi:unnamed protein product [Ilex paraguariensis]|uniref:Uncharacterized protein n=1 Tax=Ilex paraguariensis TaxID=185542 RepID=A0ABC8RI68_9AQUA